jgi:hypothetical protein
MMKILRNLLESENLLDDYTLQVIDRNGGKIYLSNKSFNNLEYQ